MALDDYYTCDNQEPFELTLRKLIKNDGNDCPILRTTGEEGPGGGGGGGDASAALQQAQIDDRQLERFNRTHNLTGIGSFTIPVGVMSYSYAVISGTADITTVIPGGPNDVIPAAPTGYSYGTERVENHQWQHEITILGLSTGTRVIIQYETS